MCHQLGMLLLLLLFHLLSIRLIQYVLLEVLPMHILLISYFFELAPVNKNDDLASDKTTKPTDKREREREREREEQADIASEGPKRIQMGHRVRTTTTAEE